MKRASLQQSLGSFLRLIQGSDEVYLERVDRYEILQGIAVFHIDNPGRIRARTAYRAIRLEG